MFLAFIKPVAKSQFLKVEPRCTKAAGPWVFAGQVIIRSEPACADRCLSETQKTLLSASEHSQIVEG